MALSPLALGHHGSIKVDRGDGQWVARCRFRDLDGVTRRVARWGTSKAGTQAALQDELRQRTGQQRTEVLKPNSRFHEAADVWMAKIRERRADSTADTLRELSAQPDASPARRAALSECDTAHLDAFFSRLERARKVIELPDGTTAEKPALAANTRRMVRAIVRRGHAAGRAAPGRRCQPGPQP